MALNLGFIFLGGGMHAEEHSVVLSSADTNMHLTGVSNYEEAIAAALAMKEKGCVAIELCAAFGNGGSAKIQEAVGEEILVGAVRFDRHPALDGKSGDSVFA